MTPGRAKLYACPHCGEKKELLQALTLDIICAETLWSDGRRIYPISIPISPIQKCEYCGSYSLYSEWKKCGQSKYFDSGTFYYLTYEEAKVAYTQLTECGSYSDKDMLTICLEFIKSYNDRFKRREDVTEGCDDSVLFKHATNKAIKLLGDDYKSLIIKGELFSERGEFNEAIEILLRVRNKRYSWMAE